MRSRQSTTSILLAMATAVLCCSALRGQEILYYLNEIWEVTDKDEISREEGEFYCEEEKEDLEQPEPPPCDFNNEGLQTEPWEEQAWVHVPNPPAPQPDNEDGGTDESNSQSGKKFCGLLGGNNINWDNVGARPEEECKKEWRLDTIQYQGICTVTYTCEECVTCSTGCAECGDNSSGGQAPCEGAMELCSLLLSFKLGLDTHGHSAGKLRLHQKRPTAIAYSPRALEVLMKSGHGVQVLRNPDYSVRQVLSANRLTDVRKLSEDSFSVSFYQRPKELERDDQGYIVVAGKAERVFTVSRPEGIEDHSQVRVEDLLGGKKKSFLYEWDSEAENFSLIQEGSGLRKIANEDIDPISGDMVRTRRWEDLEGNVIRTEEWFYQQFPFGRHLVRFEKKSGDETQTTRYEYYTDRGADGHNYGKLKSTHEPDGSWSHVSYNREGLQDVQIRPWKDSPYTDDPDKAASTHHEIRYLSPGEEFYYPGAKLLVKTEKILGVPVTRSYQIVSKISGEGRLEVVERAATPDAPFGAKGNQRSLVRYYPVREADPASDKLHFRESPDGTRTYYTYEEGNYEGAEGFPADFEPRFGARYSRKTTTTVPVALPGGIPEKTSRSVVINDPYGRTLLQETHLLSDGDIHEEAKWATLSWSGHAYDYRGRRTLSRDATGIIGEYEYNDCCNKVEWQRDRNGIETSFVYDPLNRVSARIVRAPGQDDIETHYEYDALGNVTKETVVAGDLEYETTRKYDGFGRLIAATGPDGLTTRYQHDVANRRSITILPGNTTRVEDRYLDGRTRSVRGSAVVAQFYDYGVKKDTGDRWSETTQVKPDGPRWSRSYTDALGRNFYSEAPGHGDNVVVASMNSYDTQGRLIASATGWKTESAMGGADDEKDGEVTLVGAPTLYQYHPDTGELQLTGQDVDRNNKLEPGGVDQLARSDTRYAKIGNHWFTTTKSWTYPVELGGKSRLVNDSLRRITGIGTPGEEQPGILVSETITKTATDQAGKFLTATSRTWRDRETATTTTISEGPTGHADRQTSIAGRVTTQDHGHFNVESSTFDVERSVTHRYDSLGRRIATTDPRTGESRVEYDPETGRPIAQIDPERRKTTLAYYPADHKHAGKLETATNADGKSQHQVYNERGQTTGTWGETTQPIAYKYNAYGEMVEMQTFRALPNGDPTLEPAAGSKTNWHYDEATGALLKKSYADGHGPKYEYTEAGQLKTRTWARRTISEDQRQSAVQTQYTYDKTTGALAQVTHPTEQKILNSSTPNSSTSYQYDTSGRLKKVTDPTGTREFQYDIQNRIKSEIVTVNSLNVESSKLKVERSDVVRYRINRTYTEYGQPESVALRDLNAAPGEGLQYDVNYQWDHHNQLAAVTSPAGTFTYAYDEKNPALLTKLTGPAHETTTTWEPNRNLITSITNTVEHPAGAPAQHPRSNIQDPISVYSYTNDLLGRRTEISQGGQAFQQLRLGENKVEVAYNTRSEVIGATVKGEETQSFNYAYDGIGNRTSSVAEVRGQKSEVSYKVNSLNQYNEIDLTNSDKPAENPETFLPSDLLPSHVSEANYDLDGNLLSDARNAYTWNAENRLSRVESKDGKSRVDYHYDYQGRRTIKQTFSREKPAENFQLKTKNFYIYDGWNLLAEVEQNGTNTQDPKTNIQKPRSNIADKVRYHTWGRDLSGTLQGAGGVGGLLAITETTEPLGANEEKNPKSKNQDPRSETKFPLYDANGNIGQMIDETGGIVAAYTYDPFGNVTEMVGEYAAENPWRFSTKPVEEETGWSYYGFRYYMPTEGRWASRDPIEEEGGVNLYGFVGNDGVGNWDILGKIGGLGIGGPQWPMFGKSSV